MFYIDLYSADTLKEFFALFYIDFVLFIYENIDVGNSKMYIVHSREILTSIYLVLDLSVLPVRLDY